MKFHPFKSRFNEMCVSASCENTLGLFLKPFSAKRCNDLDLPILSITKDEGMVLQSEKFKKRIASADISTYKIVPYGKLVQGIHIDERNFAIQSLVPEGVVSPAYKIWDVDDSKAIPEVLAYALRTDQSMAYIVSKFKGTIKRRESLSRDDFYNLPINLPNIDVQKEFFEFLKQVDKSKFIVRHYKRI